MLKDERGLLKDKRGLLKDKWGLLKDERGLVKEHVGLKKGTERWIFKAKRGFEDGLCVIIGKLYKIETAIISLVTMWHSSGDLRQG